MPWHTGMPDHQPTPYKNMLCHYCNDEHLKNQSILTTLHRVEGRKAVGKDLGLFNSFHFISISQLRNLQLLK
jgi:hypothetical protein